MFRYFIYFILSVFVFSSVGDPNHLCHISCPSPYYMYVDPNVNSGYYTPPVVDGCDGNKYYWINGGVTYSQATACSTTDPCDSGYVFDRDRHICILDCPDGQVYDPGSHSCVSLCNDHQHYDSNQSRCVCDLGYVSNGDYCEQTTFECPLTDDYGNTLQSVDVSQSDCASIIGNGEGSYVLYEDQGRSCCYKSLKHDSNGTHDPCDYQYVERGYYYRYQTNDSDECQRDIDAFYPGHGAFIKHDGCSFGACYYGVAKPFPGDDNSTGGDSNDTNGSGSGFNGHVIVDNFKSNYEAINSQIKSSIDRLKNVLNDNTDRTLDKLEQIRRSIMDKNLSVDLSPVTSRLDEANGHLSNIESNISTIAGTASALNDLFHVDPRQSSEYRDLKDASDSASNAIADALASLEQSKNDLIAMFDSSSAPVVSVSSGDCNFCVSVFKPNDFCIDLSPFQRFRPYLLLVLNLVFLVFTIKLYIFIFKHIVSIYLGGGE